MRARPATRGGDLPAVHGTRDRCAGVVRGTAHRISAARTCTRRRQGAFTGEISGPMLRGARLPLRDRRALRAPPRHGRGRRHGRAQAARRAARRAHADRVRGETLAEREADRTAETLVRQVTTAYDRPRSRRRREATVIAYEPVWAIGTGRVATSEQARDAHRMIRVTLDRVVGAGAGERVRHSLRRQRQRAGTRPALFVEGGDWTARWSAERRSRPPRSGRSRSPRPPDEDAVMVDATRGPIDRFPARLASRDRARSRSQSFRGSSCTSRSAGPASDHLHRAHCRGAGPVRQGRWARGRRVRRLGPDRVRRPRRDRLHHARHHDPGRRCFFVTSLLLALLSSGAVRTSRSLLQEEARRPAPAAVPPAPGATPPSAGGRTPAPSTGAPSAAPSQPAPAKPAPAKPRAGHSRRRAAASRRTLAFRVQTFARVVELVDTYV